MGTINRMHHEGGEAAEPHIQEVLPDTRHAGNEVLAALDGIRVCAPDYVIDQAEAAAQSFPNVDLEPEAFSKAGALYLKKKALFIDSVRRDLAYGAAWWQLWRKAKEKWFVWRHYSEQKQSDAGEPESAPVSAVRPGGS
ncbi:hypothetical protein ACH4TP_37615 [Streptomyces sp. NPDC021012]|uniref:hypothetical protein n=1 Tax=Streptomyces sp. NPDC021012 TaxID=3365107 RepID=UPI0037994331